MTSLTKTPLFRMSRRSSIAPKLNEKEVGKSFEELFENYLNKSKYKEAEVFARRRKRDEKQIEKLMLEMIKNEKIYCLELDDHLIPTTWFFKKGFTNTSFQL